ncbi:MAG: efflux RND transporter permease subunit [Candidatus Omnitrophica bacterium]|nr:efflux RND transporter permease subunit [Candidatus Omnitrophota bacterium]
MGLLSSFKKKFSAWIRDLPSGFVRYRKINAWSTFLAVGLLVMFIPRIRFENSVESFFPRKDPARNYYNQFKEIFSDDQLIVLVIPMGDVFTKESLTIIDDLSKKIEGLPLIRKVSSITEAQDIVGSEEGFEVLPFIEKIPEDSGELAQLKKSALANPLYQLDVVSADGKIASLMIQPRYVSDPDRYKKIMDQVRAILDQSPLRGREYYIAGEPLVELQMTQDMWKDLGVFLPLTYLCLALLIFLLFRNLQSVFILNVVITLCIGALMGLIGALGMTMNAVTVGLPSLILCIASLDGIHILGLYRFYLSKHHSPQKALEMSLAESLVPCFLTSVTTVVGFQSMAVSDLVPIRQFGILGGLATALAYPICVLTMPYLMQLVPVHFTVQAFHKEQNILMPFFRRIQKWYERKWLMTFFILSIVGISLAGISRIRVETNHLKFLRKHSPVKIATEYIQKNIAGIMPLEITVETPQEDAAKEPRILKQIEKLQNFLVTLPKVDKSVSMVQFIKEMHQAMNNEDPDFYFIPDSRELIAQYILTYSFSGRDNDLDDFVDYNYRIARIRGRMEQQSSAELKVTLGAIQNFIKKNFDPDLKVRITSHSLLQANMVDTLVEGQIGGLTLEFFLMILIFAWAHRSLVIGLFSLVPNVIPLMTTAGLMGWTGISLNAGTAMTVCIAFGLVVDDTIHFFHHARECLKKETNPSWVTLKIFEVVGSPVLFTSALLTSGFVILVFGQSLLTVAFGILCAFAIVWALVCELFITPFLITRVRLFRQALMKS